MFRTIDVWERTSARAVCYRCFQSLKTGKYSVQSADFYQLPKSLDELDQLKRQHVELFLEQAPDERSGAYETLEAAIEAHKTQFSGQQHQGR